MPVELVCVTCGDSYEVIPSRADDSKFCTHECYAKSLKETGSHFWNGGDVETECENCGTEITKEKAEYENHEHHFCKKACQIEWLAQNQKGKDHPNYNSVEIACGWCGSIFTREKSKANRYNHAFCSRDCYHAWQSEEGVISGENHPRWIGGTSGRYGPGWSTARTRALERDDHTCQRCGLTEEKHREKHAQGRGLDVHHLKRVESFKDQSGEIDYETAHQLDNLESLCQSCHGEAEHEIEQ